MTWIRYKDRLYDISNLDHPGGRVIQTYAYTDDNPIDATNCIQAMHHRAMPNLLKTLSSLPVDTTRTVLPPRDPVEVDFQRLRQELIRDGMFEPSVLHIVRRFLMVGALWLLGFYCLFHRSVLTGIIVCSVGWQQVGWLEHEGGHNSLTGVPLVDKLVQMLLYNVLLAGNFRKWNHQHFSHHANTQHSKHDVDLKTMPLVAFHQDMRDPRQEWGWLIRRQHWLYVLLINPLVWFIWGFFSHPFFAWKKGHFVENCLTRASAYVLHVGTLVSFGYSLWTALCIFHVYSMLGTNLLLLTFTVSHTTTNIRHDDIGWVRPAASHTINNPDHVLTNWWMGYLNFQIEHHLFPSMPQFRQPFVSTRYVQPFLQKHRLPYRVVGFWKALVDVFTNLASVARSEPKPRNKQP